MIKHIYPISSGKHRAVTIKHLVPRLAMNSTMWFYLDDEVLKSHMSSKRGRRRTLISTDVRTEGPILNRLNIAICSINAIKYITPLDVMWIRTWTMITRDMKLTQTLTFITTHHHLRVNVSLHGHHFWFVMGCRSHCLSRSWEFLKLIIWISTFIYLLLFSIMLMFRYKAC